MITQPANRGSPSSHDATTEIKQSLQLSNAGKEDYAKWVLLAHDQALKSRATGGIPIGAVLVHAISKKVIAVGHNQRVQKNSNILHGEMDCFENAGRRFDGGPVPWQDTVCVTTLSPCLMCTGAILMYGIPTVVIAEHKNYLSPGEETLRSKGINVIVMDDPACTKTMSEWIAKNEDLWSEDVAGNVEGASQPHRC